MARRAAARSVDGGVAWGLTRSPDSNQNREPQRDTARRGRNQSASRLSGPQGRKWAGGQMIVSRMNQAGPIQPIVAMSKMFSVSASLAAAANLFVNPARAADHSPVPSGPQTDGAFRKVILDSDREISGKWEDTVKDP